MYIRNRERGLEKIGWSSSHTRCSTITITLIWIACADAGSKLKKINNKIMCRLCLVIISNETWDRGISWKKEREKVLIETQYINAVLVIRPWNLRQANKEFCLFLKAVEGERSFKCLAEEIECEINFNYLGIKFTLNFSVMHSSNRISTFYPLIHPHVVMKIFEWAQKIRKTIKNLSNSSSSSFNYSMKDK